MKHALLILIVATVFVKPLAPFVEYALNYDYISKVLCENKDEPTVHCDGKCYLKKSIDKNNTEDNRSSSHKLNFMETSVLFCEKITSFHFEKLTIAPEKLNLKKWVNTYSFDYTQNLFHPPILGV